MNRHLLPCRDRVFVRALSGLFLLVASCHCHPGAQHARAAEPDAVGAVENDVVQQMTGSFESQGKTISIERFEPKAPGRYPAVLVIHGAGGMTIGGVWFRESARMLAKQGYVAHVVHYFDLTGTKVADQATMKTHFAGWTKVLADGVANVSKQPNVDPKRVGLLGFSLGSYLSLSLSMYDPRIAAVVEYFGGLPDVLARDLKSLPPVLILHGEADPVVPVSQARALEKLCKDKKIPYEMHLYPGQGHGFLGETGRDASRRTLEFLDAHVKNVPAPPARETSAVPRPELFAVSREKPDAD